MKIKLSHIRYIAPILIIALFFLPAITYAADRPWWDVLNLTGTINDTLLNSLNGILGFFKTALSTILGSAIIPLLNNVMSFQNFFTDGVNAGWTATRDFANLFFALILLFIAIATVLNTGGLDNYTAKRMLPNFIFAALFINFSKAIVGFLIDISQIIMISLYNSFGPTLTDSIASASKIAEAGSESKIDPAIISLLTIILLVILIFVLLWTAVILIVRIVTLWFVIMLSPLAFVSGLIPPLSSISRSWQNMLQQALITGPTLMFLLYLAVTVMNASIGGNTSGGGNLIENGNLLNYALVIGLLIIANIEAQKAGQSAPPILKNAVGVAGTVATFGLGAYVGAGGYNTNQLRKKTLELADKGAGGVTSITGQNARYESAKKDFKNQQATGTGMFGSKKVNVLGRDMNINPLSYTQGFSAEGKKQQLEDFEKEKAKKLEDSGAIYKKENARYLRMISSIEAEAAKEAKEKSSIPELGKELKEALDKGDKFTARALASRVSEIKGGWEELFGNIEGKTKSGGNAIFAEYAKDKPGNPAAQLDSFITKNFETRKDGSPIYRVDDNGKTIEGQFSPIANNFRTRQAQLLKDKGSANFAAGLVERDTTENTPYKKAVEKGIRGAGAEFAKNDSMFSGSGSFDFNSFYPIIEKETSLDLLADPESWIPFNNNRAEMITKLKEKLTTDPRNPKIKAALKGLGASASSRVTGDTI
jgi:hypothetical protein